MLQEYGAIIDMVSRWRKTGLCEVVGLRHEGRVSKEVKHETRHHIHIG